MDAFDKIAGYEKQKKDLRYISDMWKTTKNTSVSASEFPKE